MNPWLEVAAITTQHVFLYEFATAQPRSVELPECLRREGAAMLAALVQDFRAIPGVDVLTMPEVQVANEERVFREIAGQADWAMLIAPESKQELHRRVAWLRGTGCRLLGPTPEALRLLADKFAFHGVLASAGVSTPRTWLASELPARDVMPRKLVAKPRWGAGSQDVRLLPALAELPQGPEWLVQEFVPGVPASIAFLCGPKRSVPLLPCAQYLSSDGTFSYLGGEVSLRPDLGRRATLLGTKALDAARTVAGFVGYVGFDLVLGDADLDYVIEMNLRLTTSYLGLRQAAMQNLAEVPLELQQDGPGVPAIAWRSEPVQFCP